MGEKSKIRKLKKQLALSLAAALMVSALPWQADTAFASEILGIPETAVLGEPEAELIIPEGGSVPGERGQATDMTQATEIELDGNAEDQEVAVDIQNQEDQETLLERTTRKSESYLSEIIANGRDNDIIWTLDVGGKLTISGRGDYSFYPYEGLHPNLWGDYLEFITSAEVNVTGMTSTAEMFWGCINLTSVNLTGLDTSKLEDMSGMFDGCRSLTSLDLSHLDIRKVWSMSGMFRGCSSLTSLDLGSFDASMSDMRLMFENCSSLKSLDLSKINMKGIGDTRYMLNGCDKLETIDTPLYVERSIELPKSYSDGILDVWYCADGTAVTKIPENLGYSIRLGKSYVPEESAIEAPAYEITDYIGGKEVTFESTIPGAVIYYSKRVNITVFDSNVENGGKLQFENFDGKLFARSYANGQWGKGAAEIVLDIPQVATPIISNSENKVMIEAPTEGSTIYYTTDGSTPTLTNGKKSTSSCVTIDTLSGTIKAIAVKSGYANSPMARKVLLNSNKDRNVSFGVKGVFGGRNVTFNSETKGAKVYYSSTTSTLTTKDKCVNAGDTVLFEDFYGTIYARTYYNGEWGNPCRLILKIPVVNTPTVTVDSKGYATIKTATPKSRIYYTTDGSTPSMKNGKMVSSPYVRVYVGKGKTVKAIAVRSCFTHSKVGTGK